MLCVIAGSATRVAVPLSNVCISAGIVAHRVYSWTYMQRLATSAGESRDSHHRFNSVPRISQASRSLYDAATAQRLNKAYSSVGPVVG